MQQEKIGNFIAQCRKKKNLTQSQLAGETGKGMPDSSVMLELCNCLGISVNELLNGEYLQEEQNREKDNKNNMIEEAKENKKEKNKIIVIMISIIFCLLVVLTLSAIYNSFAKPTNYITGSNHLDFPNIENKYFVRTYHILDIADSHDGEHLYLTIRKYQAEEIETIKVSKKLINHIQEDKSYEFTFQYKNKDFDDTNIMSILANATIISIVETDKLGMDQRQDPVR